MRTRKSLEPLSRDDRDKTRSRDGRALARGAFTLIEVLVVVTVIALLVSLLMPSLSAARRHAQRVACLSNLRQITLGWHLYLEAHRGEFLQKVNANYNYGGKQGSGSSVFGADPTNPVRKPLNRYLNYPLVMRQGADLFVCPSDRGTETERPTIFDYYGTSYTTNIRLVGPDRMSVNPFEPCVVLTVEMNKRLPGLNRSQVDNESKLLLLAEYGWIHTLNPASPKKVEWHGRRCFYNAAFMDGHVAFLRIRPGAYVAGDYTVIPFSDLNDDAATCQQEVACE